MPLLTDINDILEVIPDNEFDAMSNISNIAGNVYVGDWKAGNDDKVINDYKIEYIICISESHYYNPIAHYQIQIPDTPNGKIENYFDQTYKMILNCCEHNQNILVISDNGVSRSAIIVIHYLMRRYYETGGPRHDNDLLYMFKFYIEKRPCDTESTFIKKLVDEWKKMSTIS